jgi:hypothetical protein
MNYNAELLAQDLSESLPKWNAFDQDKRDWWVNAAWHSMKGCGSFTLMGYVSTTGQDVVFKRDTYLI